VAILPLEIDAVEAFRPQAELRLNFAKAIQRKTGEPLSLTLFKYTDIYRRLGLGEPPKDVRGPEDLHPVWNALVREIEEATDSAKTFIDRALQIRRESGHTFSDEGERRVGMFTYSILKEAKPPMVDIHVSPLKQQRNERMSPTLLYKDMVEVFRRIKEEYPESADSNEHVVVRGSTWLYRDNMESLYRFLFPDSYVNSKQERKTGFDGGGRWGQFIDQQGNFKANLAAELLNNVERYDVDKLYKAFPNPTYTFEAPIVDFYAKYGL